MKLNPKNIVIIAPQKSKMEASNRMIISKKSVTISSTLVKKMGCPEYVRLYLDRVDKQFFIVPCKAEVEGARKFYRSNSKGKSKTVSFSSPRLAKMLAEIGGFDLEVKRYRFKAEDVEGRENALGFDLLNPEKSEEKKHD